MRRTKISVLAALIAIASLPVPAGAHHSFAMFDMAETIKLTGTVKELQWANPHVWIQVDVVRGGRTTEWSIEGGSPSMLSALGWRRTSLRPGDRVELAIHPLRNGNPGGALVSASVNGKLIARPVGTSR